MPGGRDIGRECGEQQGRCPVFGIKSGIPLIGSGGLLILLAVVTLFIHGLSPVFLPALFIFTGFGLFLVWMGIAR